MVGLVLIDTGALHCQLATDDELIDTWRRCCGGPSQVELELTLRGYRLYSLLNGSPLRRPVRLQ